MAKQIFLCDLDKYVDVAHYFNEFTLSDHDQNIISYHSNQILSLKTLMTKARVCTSVVKHY